MEGFTFKVLDSNEFQETLELTINVGASIPKHKAYWKTLFYVAQGEVEFSTDEGTYTLKTGESLSVVEETVRSSKNIGSVEAKIVVVKSGELKKEPEFI